LLPFRAFVDAHGAHNAVQRADAQWIVVWNRKPLMRRRVRLQDNVAAFLMHHAILPVPAQDSDQLRAAQIARDFHAPARISSRTKCSRMRRWVWGWSKKWPRTASWTFWRTAFQ